MIRCVTNEKFSQKIAIHYIGWALKWDEWIDSILGNAKTQRIAKRNTITIGPHRARGRNPSGLFFEGNNAFIFANLYQNQLRRLSKLGYFDRNENIKLLKQKNEDVDQVLEWFHSYP